ncbi:MAG TPA: hypothetical protein VF074_13230 [Pyrinomonadaceae bacterium]
MKLRFLYSILFACLFLGLTLVSETAYSQAPDSIIETETLAMLNAIDRAARKGNVAGIIAPLAKDIKIKMTISTPGSDKQQVLNLSKDQYAFLTRRALQRRIGYQYDRKNTRIKIYSDNKTAMVTSDVYETLTVRQGTVRAASSEVAIVSLRNGKPVITSLEARTRFY